MATIKKSVKKLQVGGNTKGYNPSTSPLPNTITKGGYEKTLDRAGNNLILRGGDKKEISRAQIGTKQEEAMRKDYASKKAFTEGARTENTNFLESRKKTGAVANNLKSGGKAKKMKNGGSLSAVNKSSSKRVGPVDPKGAFTKVQKKTLAGAKGKASLTKDKQLGATKMKSGGCMSCGGKMAKKK